MRLHKLIWVPHYQRYKCRKDEVKNGVRLFCKMVFLQGNAL